MYCTKCGGKVGPKDKYCAKCGNVLKPQEANKPQTEITPPTSSKIKADIIPNKKSRKKKAGIITGSVLGSIIVLAVIGFFLLNYFNFPIMQIMQIFRFGDNLWQYDKKIKKPITAISSDENITLGSIDGEGVSVFVPSQVFDNQSDITLSHPEIKPEIDKASFEPLGAPISIDSTGRQKRLNKPIRITLSIENADIGKSGVPYIASLNERMGWDYIEPDEIDLEKKIITFTTCRLGTYGFVNLKKEKFVSEFSRNKALRQWSVRSLEREAGISRDEIVKDVLQNRLAIIDKPTLEKVNDAVKTECPSDKLAILIADKDNDKFTQMIVESVERNIPRLVDSMILKEALDTVSLQPWVKNISENLSGKLKEGNLTQATKLVVEEIADEFIEERVENLTAVIADLKIRIWDDPGMQEAFEIYKNGTKDEESLWGYQVSSGDFDKLWDQMKGVAKEVINTELNSYCISNNKKAEELTEEEIKIISQDAKQRTKNEFSERLEQEKEIEKIKNENISMVQILEAKGLFSLEESNPAFEPEDDIANLINRIYGKIEDIKRDTERFEVVLQDEKISQESEANPEKMIKAQDLADLVYIWFEKGEESYKQKITDLKLIIKQEEPVEEEDVIIEVANMDLNDLWQRDDGLLIEIIGTEGYFRSLVSSWQVLADAGIISIGDPKIKNILQISDNKWTCDDLWYAESEEESQVYWSDWAEITMSDDGKSLVLETKATHPVSGEKREGSRLFNRYSGEQDIQESEENDSEESEEEDSQNTEKTDLQDSEEDSQNKQETDQELTIPEQTVELGLDGYWRGSNDFVMKIEGNSSIFIQFSPWQQAFADLGMVSIGDLQMKEIEKTGENQWSCFVFYFYSLDDEPYGVGWSEKSTITLSEDGKLITLESSGKHPKTGTVFNNTSEYTRTISPVDQ